MNKDTIYIDVEDDITAIIGKVKASNHKIVALVPPKRIGVLQSAVNLRLLARVGKQYDKRLVLVTGNQALMMLAASAGIPSARNLQSKPELAQLPEKEDDTGEDVIDGAQLPVGELAKTGDDDSVLEEASPKSATAIDSAIRANTIEEVSSDKTPRPTREKRNIKVPDFGTVRKKLALGVGALVILVGFLVWAVIFAPSATITITARTIESSANPKVVLTTSASTDVNAGTIQAVRYEIKQEASLAFDATGSKEIGEKAAGKVVFQNCESDSPVSVPSGTGISAGGRTYITQADATVPAAQGFAMCTKAGQSTPVPVVAKDIGEEYNTDEGTRFSVAGHAGASSLFYFRAEATEDIAGGTKETVKVVTQEDIEKAAQDEAKQNIEMMKRQLEEKFGDDAIAIESTYGYEKEGVSSAPAVNGEAADGKAKLQGSITYYMLGVSKIEAGRYLDGYFAKEIKEEENQRVYNNGVDKTSFIDVRPSENGATATMTATATFGPKIDNDRVKSEAQGKRYGEVQSAIEQIAGVESVDVKFSPFWVRTVPKNEKRITVEFNLDESE